MQTTVIRGAAGVYDWGLNSSADLKASDRLLHTIAQNPSMGSIVRLYRPAPTVAFSGLEQRLDGFREAIGEATAFGFETVIRPAGGRMVALDEHWLVLDIITPESTRAFGHRDVYHRFGEMFVQVLEQLGVEAHFGPVDGEYCPGDYSINARNEVKLVGTAQRVRRGARLFSASIPYSISVGVSELFDRINGLLGLEWNNETLGSVNQEVSGVTIDDLEAALLSAFAAGADEYLSLADVFSKGNRLSVLS